ncbi:Protein phosphatase 1B [Trichinella spiralis]|uniref:Protein phosphatase 1B n=1 Tax=Trichinella spiralis TaxID=6334 RepID=A0A0V1BJH8_TRISP|nr:Protein phosphatase 1B [Trichinella spiralis]KRY37074.1 Protein phosphatase 1B [Trichinella spiralis]
MLTFEHGSAIAPDKNACRHVSICLIERLIVNIAAFARHLVVYNLVTVFLQHYCALLFCFDNVTDVLFCFYRLRLISHLCNDECILPLLNLSFTNKSDLNIFELTQRGLWLFCHFVLLFGSMGTYLDKPRVEKTNESGAGQDLKYGVATMQGWRIEMEDAHIACTNLPEPLKHWSFFAVFDGHAGHRVARYAAANLLEVVLNTTELVELKRLLQDNGGREEDVLNEKEIELVKQGLRSAFLQLDEQMRLLPELSGDTEKSGSTVVCAMISPGHIFVANLGDSRALVCCAGKVSFATEDHKPYLPKERCRIVNAGGSVMIDRVNGSLAVSRALGDYEYKNVDGLNACEQLVSPEPDLYVIERTNDGDEQEQFLLLACDGVFDVMTNQELCDFILSRLRVSHNLEIICNEILDSCLSKDSRDNMSVVLVAFPGAPKICEKALEREMQLESLLREKIEAVFQQSDNPETVTYQQVVSCLMREEIPGAPCGTGMHALRGKLENILETIRRGISNATANNNNKNSNPVENNTEETDMQS